MSDNYSQDEASLTVSTPYDYRDWLLRARNQEDPYAKFFMFILAVLTAHLKERNEYDKFALFGKEIDDILLENSNADFGNSKEVESALKDMLGYITENRQGEEIMNLSYRRGSTTYRKTTSFRANEEKMFNALTSIQIVRNNLFHGDKKAFNQNDIEIIQRCNAILETTLSLYTQNKIVCFTPTQ